MVIFTRAHIIFLISILLFSLFLFNQEKQYFLEREVYCIDLVSAGALYGGQTLCGNPPLAYYAGYLLLIFFENYLQTATFILMMALSGAIIILLYNYLKPSTVFEFAFFLMFSVVLLAYSTLDFATTLSLFFVFLSFFIIRKSSKPEYVFLAGCFYALALSSKIISLLFLPPLIVCIFYVHFSSKKLFLKRALTSATFFLIPVAGLSILLYVIYPFLPFYISFAHTILHPHWTFFGAVKYAAEHFNLQHFLILFLNIIAALLLLRGEVHALCLLPLAFWHVYLTKSNSIFETGEPLFMNFFTYYFLIFFPFLFIVLFSIARKVKSKKVLHHASLLAFMAFFVYFGLYLSPSGLHALSYQPIPERPAEIQTLLTNFYQNFAYDDGIILTNKRYASIIPESRTAQLRFSNFPSVINQEDFGYGDPNYGPGIKKLPIYNSSAYNPKLIKDKSDFSSKINSTLTAVNTTKPTLVMSDYETILIGGVLKQQSYCHVFVPILLENKNGLHHVNYFYKNKTLCTTAKQKVHDFISSNFNTFCSFDEKIADEYAPITKSNGARFNQTCSSGAKGYEPAETRTDIVSLAVLAVFVVTFTLSLFP